MNPLIRALKALRQLVLPRPRWSPVLLPRTTYDYRAAIGGDGSQNNIVQAVVRWIVRAFPEAPVVVVEQGPDGQRTVDWTHPLPRLIERPNPYYSGVLLWYGTIADWALTANAYWLIVRGRGGRPEALWWAPSWSIEPRSDDDRVFITHYEYRPAPGVTLRLDPRDVVHFRDGMDPNNPRKGRSALTTLWREIFTDEEAANFTASLMRNLGVPGVVMIPQDLRVQVTEESAREIADRYRERFGGDNRGEPLVMSAPVDVKVLSFSPEQMTLRDLRRVPEERVTAIYGVAAVVVGLGAGLDRSTFQNFAEAREAAYEQNIIPTQRLIAADLTTQLLPQFDERPNVQVEFDLSRVRVLQGDWDALVDRHRTAVLAGFERVSEARRALGLPVDPRDEIYLRPLNMIEVPVLGTPGTAAGGGRPGLKAADPAAALRRYRSEHLQELERAAAALVAREREGILRAARRASRKQAEAYARELDEWLAAWEPELREEMDAALTPYLLGAATAAAALAGRALPPRPALEPFLRAYVGAAVNRWLGSTRGQALSVYSGALADGADPLDALRARLDEWEASRPAKWAAWESAQGLGAASQHAYALVGVTRKVWRASAAACPYCRSLDGAVLEVEKQFVAEGEAVEAEERERELVIETGLGHPPAHAGCDCVILPEAGTLGRRDGNRPLPEVVIG